MSNVIAFPSKDHRQWAGIAESIEVYLSHLGATAAEIPSILSRLRERWELLGAQFDTPSYSIPGPLSEEQSSAFNAALAEQAAFILQKWHEEGARTLMEFAKLEYQLLRAG